MQHIDMNALTLTLTLTPTLTPAIPTLTPAINLDPEPDH